MSKEGVSKVHGLGDIADWEKDLLEACLKDLAANIKKVNSSFQFIKTHFCRARTLLLRILDVKVDLLYRFLSLIAMYSIRYITRRCIVTPESNKSRFTEFK